MLYMIHSKQLSLVKPFIFAGGLRVLVSIFSHPLVTLRGQALFHFLHLFSYVSCYALCRETFLQIANEEVFDWFDAKTNSDNTFPQKSWNSPSSSIIAETTDEVMLLLNKMKDLDEYGIVKSLISNSGSLLRY